MRRSIIVFILLLISISSFAREPGNSQIIPHFGIGYSGADFKSWSGSDLGFYLVGDPTVLDNAELEYSMAYNWGADIVYFISSLAIVTGLIYEYKPVLIVYPKKTATKDFELKAELDFITIPIGVRYYLDIFYFGGGVYYGTAVGKADTETRAAYTETGSIDINNDFGLFLDIGLNYNFGEEIGIDIYLRYERGLVEIYDEEAIITDIKTRAFYLNAGVSYNL
jgi:hypothetical protein